LPFAVRPWSLGFIDRWQAATARRTPWQVQLQLCGELCNQLKLDGISANDLIERDIPALLNCILSFKNGRPVGSAQRNLLEVINTFLNISHRHRYARVLKRIIINTGRVEFLERESVKKKFSTAMSKIQESPESLTGQIILALFSDLLGKKVLRPV
jgi:hypothetical protein